MSKDTTLIDTKKDWYRQPGEGAEPYKYPANHQVKQCVPNTIAISEYGRNRGPDSKEFPSTNGILYIQKNVATDQNGLRLNNSELTEIITYILFDNKRIGRQAWASEAERDIKKLLRGLKNIPFYSNEPLVNYSNEEIGNFRLNNSTDAKKDEYKNNSNFNKDGIYVLPWDKI